MAGSAHFRAYERRLRRVLLVEFIENAQRNRRFAIEDAKKAREGLLAEGVRRAVAKACRDNGGRDQPASAA